MSNTCGYGPGMPYIVPLRPPDSSQAASIDEAPAVAVADGLGAGVLVGVQPGKFRPSVSVSSSFVYAPDCFEYSFTVPEVWTAPVPDRWKSR